MLYAHQWAYGRNPAFYDYENVGGDCTNFASQCVFAGSGDDELHPGFRLVLHRRQPEVPLLDRGALFLEFHDQAGALRRPVAQPCALEDLQPGDLVQLSFNGQEFQHTPVVVRVTAPITLETVLIAAHSYDADNPAPVHLHVPGHPVSARTGHHPALGNRLRKMNRENRLGGSASQPVSFCFFLDFFTCDKGFAFAAIRRDSLSMWV